MNERNKNVWRAELPREFLDAINMIACVLDVGEEKHGDAWKTRQAGDDLDHASAHLADPWRVEPETGLPSLAHAAARIVIALQRGADATRARHAQIANNDDRKLRQIPALNVNRLLAARSLPEFIRSIYCDASDGEPWGFPFREFEIWICLLCGKHTWIQFPNHVFVGCDDTCEVHSAVIRLKDSR